MYYLGREFLIFMGLSLCKQGKNLWFNTEQHELWKILWQLRRKSIIHCSFLVEHHSRFIFPKSHILHFRESFLVGTTTSWKRSPNPGHPHEAVKSPCPALCLTHTEKMLLDSLTIHTHIHMCIHIKHLHALNTYMDFRGSSPYLRQTF